MYDTVVGKRLSHCLQREREWESDFSRHVGCDLGIAVSHSFVSEHTIPRPCIVVCMPTIHSVTTHTRTHTHLSVRIPTEVKPTTAMMQQDYASCVVAGPKLQT